MPGRGIARFLLGVALSSGCVTAFGKPSDEWLRDLALAEGPREPLYRIGLDSGARLAVSSVAPFRVVDPDTREAVWKAEFRGELTVVVDGGPQGSVARVYRIQLGAFSSEEAALAAGRRVEASFGVQTVVRRIPDRGSWRLRIGEAADRDALLPLLGRMRAQGHEDAFVSEEPATLWPDARMRLVDATWEDRKIETRRVVILPSAGERLFLEGKPYRGLMELRLTPWGTVRAINWIGLESYLRGVVPAELGPETWPQLEALKAQAVAARTYAWRNRGQFEEEGFDLCATPRCQAYGGASAEHPLSDRAVAVTRGEIAVWNGRPIQALYTATCGGQTESAAEVFPEEAAPYLVGVPCRAESGDLAILRTRVTGLAPTVVVAENGEDVSRDWGLLAAASVLPPDAQAARTPWTKTSLHAATGALMTLAGLATAEPPETDVGTLSGAMEAALNQCGWNVRAELLLHPDDAGPLLRDRAIDGLPDRARRAMAYAASLGAIRPFADGAFRVGEPATPARFAPLLVRIGESYDAFGLREAVFASRAGSTVVLAQGKSTTRLEIAADARLFAWSGSTAVPAGFLDLWPGDRLRYRKSRSGRIDFLEIRPPVKGTADDRSSVVHSWEVRRTRTELEDLFRNRVPVGELTDLRVERRTTSGRVVSLRVVGSEGSAVLRGFDVRSVLDLRENWFTLETQRKADGLLDAVVFAGKGWGHGVGLCQVGAYGMALRGADYRAVLAHYYPGTSVLRLEELKDD